ncbi:MAG: GvpL/GvpF family gas vesicle protein [Pseudanabaenaceae cyanobacterium bins.68]|nr:GvpL/GvpF family gas vesicle protein [Pseudanabaenaceae cyanobacterium bins.68]
MANSAICVYGLYLGDRSEPIWGIGGKPLQDLEWAELKAVFEPEIDLHQMQTAEPEQSLGVAIAYSEIQIQIFAQVRSMLPWSFRSAFFPSLELFQTFLAPHSLDFTYRLGQLEGCGELSLAGKFQPTHPPTPLGGRAYFLAKKQAFAQQQQAASVIAQLFQPQQTIWQSPRGQEQFRAILLVKLSQLPSSLTQINQWQSEHPDWELEISQPLPPYSFV